MEKLSAGKTILGVNWPTAEILFIFLKEVFGQKDLLVDSFVIIKRSVGILIDVFV